MVNGSCCCCCCCQTDMLFRFKRQTYNGTQHHIAITQDRRKISPRSMRLRLSRFGVDSKLHLLRFNAACCSGHKALPSACQTAITATTASSAFASQQPFEPHSPCMLQSCQNVVLQVLFWQQDHELCILQTHYKKEKPAAQQKQAFVFHDFSASAAKFGLVLLPPAWHWQPLLFMMMMPKLQPQEAAEHAFATFSFVLHQIMGFGLRE